MSTLDATLWARDFNRIERTPPPPAADCLRAAATRSGRSPVSLALDAIRLARAPGHLRLAEGARCPSSGARGRDTVASMQPDATCKHLLSFPIMVEELLRWLVGNLNGMNALVDALDFSTLTRVHEQSVTVGARGLRRRSNDMVWRVGFRGRSASEPEASSPGAGGWLYLVVMLEFQSRVDPLMALRIRTYADSFHAEQWRGREFRFGDHLAPVLPIVLYNGLSPWRAAKRVIDLVTPGSRREASAKADADASTETGAGYRMNPLFSGDGYLLLDTHRVGADDLRRDNAAALLAGLENPRREEFFALLKALRERLRAPELDELREVMLSWAARQMRRQMGVVLEAENMAQEVRPEDFDDVDAYYAARLEAWREEDREEGREEGRNEGRTEGLAEGRAEGQRALLCRQAALKFGEESAVRLAEQLEGVTDQEAFDAVSATIIGHDTPAGMLLRAADANRRENGNSAPGGG